MVVEKVKGLMEELNLNQYKVAEELTQSTDKYYSQSMISKRLKHDDCLSVEELINITLILNRYYKLKYGSNNKLRIDYFFVHM